jgi:predicted DNA-binding protein
MVNRAKSVGRPPNQKPRSIRASVSLSPEIYRSIEALARQKKVSTAWVLRDAAEKYIDDQWPLLGGP